LTERAAGHPILSESGPESALACQFLRPRGGTVRFIIARIAQLARRCHFSLWLMAALVVAGTLLLARRWSNEGFEIQSFLRSVSGADWRWLLCAWLLGLASYYGRALRWMVMLRPLAPSATRWQVFRATAIGFSAVLLVGRPGELVRPWLIARANKVPFPTQMAVWLIERIYDTLTIFALFGYSLAVVSYSSRSVGPTLGWVLQRGGWIAGVTATLCLAVLIVLQSYADRLERRLTDALGFLQAHHQERLTKLIRSAVEGLSAARSPRATVLLVAYTALEWFVIYLCYLAVFRAFPETAALGTPDVLAYIGFVAFGSVVQLPGIGGGFQLVSVAVMTELFHIDLEPATGFALVCWAVALLGVAPIGVILALSEGLSWRKLLEINQETET